MGLINRYLSLALAVCVASCDATTQPDVLSGQTMGTTYSVALYESANNRSLPELQLDIEAILDDVNEVASTYRDDSELSQFNSRTSIQWQAVSDDFCQMVERSLAISEFTDGAFDITVGPLVELWGFGATDRQSETPSDQEVLAALRSVGRAGVETDCSRPAIRKNHGDTRLDLSAWAKGYAADRIAEHLSSVGFSDFLVEVGGELQLGGNRSGSKPYRIALEHAASSNDLTYEVFALTDTGVATSGDYHNYYEVDGQRFSHTIDPRTGRPVTHSLSSVSVISDSTADADAYATALLVMGPERGYEFAIRNNIAAYMTEYAGDGVKTRETPAFSRLARPAQ